MGETTIDVPGRVAVSEPTAVLGGDRVLLSGHTDQSPRWTPGERLHHVFEATCDRLRASGDSARPAVSRDGVELTYDALDARANRLARHLRARGVRAGQRVAFVLDDAEWTYAAMLAVLKLHAAYVPLDAGFPADRIAFIVDDADVGTVLTQSHLRERLDGCDAQVLVLDDDQGRIDALDGDRLGPDEVDQPVDDLGYVIYTSGTTGRPKGVPIEHASIVNFVRVAADVYGVRPDDRMYQGLTAAFDFSVEEIWVSWAVGATLVPKPGRNLLGADLAEFLRSERVTALCCVPTLLATVDDDLPDLRFLLVSGEACPQDLVARWHRPGRRFLNTYGPTEATVTATWTTLHPDRPVTIGVPLPTYAVLVLEQDGDRVLDGGEPGEIAIGGICLSPGYLNRPDATAKAFVPDPVGLANNPSGQVYRTGDRGRITDDGLVEYLGRIDTQVKIRGYRIELTEIESLLLQVPGVAQAVVDTHEPESGSTELVAYYTEKRSGPPVDPDAALDGMREQLPIYMVPTYAERLDEMPMLPSDKADRKNLPAPSGPRRLSTSGPVVGPEGPVEAAVAAAVAELLGVEEVSVEADLFAELGLSSLLVAQLSTRLRTDPTLPPISTKALYLHPTVRSLAASLDGVAPRAETGPRRVYVAPTWRYLLCGTVQVGLLAAAGVLLALLGFAGYTVLGAANGIVDGYLRAVAVATGTFVVLSALPVVAKWLLVGRWRAGTFPLWGLRYLRWWVLRNLLRSSPMVLFTGSPLYSGYLRLLGARVGAGAAVFARRLPVCTDLLTIGAGAVVRKDAVLAGYHAESGLIRTGRVTVGAGAVVGEASVLDVDTELGERAQLGHASALRAGQTVPAGARVHGSPAEPCDTEFGLVEPRTVSTRRRVGYSAFQLAVLALVSGPAVVAVLYVLVPALYGAAAGIVPGTGPGFLLGWLVVAAAAVLAAIVLRLAALLTLPRLLHRVVDADTTYPLYGVHWAVHRAIGRLSNSRLFVDLLGDSSYVVPFLRVIGYDLAPVQQTGSNFGLAVRHDSPVHTRVGTGTLVSDGLTVANAEYSATSFVVSRVTVGERNFLGNNIVVPPQSRAGDNVLLATKVMVPVDGPVRHDTGLLGSPAFEIPRSTRDAAPDVAEDGPARLAAKNRSNLATMGAFLLQRILLAYLGLLLTLAAFALLPGVGGVVVAVLGSLVVGVGFAVLVERAAMAFRRLRPRTCSIYRPYYWRHERLWKLSRMGGTGLVAGTPLAGVLWRLGGVRVGRRLFDDGATVPEKTLVTIGDDASVNAGAIIQCHSLEDGTFTSDAVSMGDGVTLGVNCFVHHGTSVGNRAVIDADSFLMKGSAVVDDSRWRGNPAVEVAGEGDPVVSREPVGRRIARAALVAAVAVGAALAVTVAVQSASTPVASQEDGSVALAGWLVTATDPAVTISVADPALRAELETGGVPAARLADDGRLVVVAAPDDPADLARFGDLAVRDREGVAAAGPDSGLADNPRLVASPDVREVIRAGGLDERATAVLAGLAGRGSVTVVAVPALPGETPQLPRHTVVLEGVDPAAQDWLRAQRGTYAPEIGATGVETTLSWPVPVPSALSG